MKRIVGVDQRDPVPRGKHFDVNCVRCSAGGCVFPIGTLAVERSRFEDCEVANFIVNGGVFREVVVVGAKCAAFVQFAGCFFDRVTIAGRIRGMVTVLPAADVRFEQEFYRDVPWAVDVRGIESIEGMSLLGVPSELVLGTPGVDWLVTRASAERADFVSLMEGPGGWWASVVSGLLLAGRESMVVVGPRGRNSAARKSAEGIARCVDMGVMLPLSGG